jgi:tetratricopeptide (TPR) repeat protein
MNKDERIFKIAFKLFRKKKFKKSLCLIDELIKNEKEFGKVSFNALFLKGDLCHELYDFSGAVKIYSKILSYKKNNDNAFANRALAYWELKEYRKALNDYLKAVKFNDCNGTAHYGAGEMSLKLNMPKKAIPRLKRAIELRPEYSYSYTALGEAYYQLSKWGTAYGYFIKAVKLNKNDEMAKGRISEIDEYFETIEKNMKETDKKGK